MIAIRFYLFSFFLASFSSRGADILPFDRCKTAPAQAALEKGMALQVELESEDALAAYKECLSLDTECGGCRYEMGWSYWKLGQWDEVIRVWKEQLKLNPKHPRILEYLPAAQENKKTVASGGRTTVYRSKVPLGIESEPKGAPVGLIFLTRRQSYNPTPDDPLDVYDTEVNSPKSVHFAPDGKTVFVNALEGGKTLVYDSMGFQKVATVSHKFGKSENALFEKKPNFEYSFPKEVKKPNEFMGKPVELDVSHGGRFLWIPYYRRDFDKKGTAPSAVAVVDSKDYKIRRVLSTGPITKYVLGSPKGRWMALSNWGDNTISLFDIRGDDPAAFKPEWNLVVEEKLDLTNVSADRDRDCGFCVRGLAYTPDEKYLFAARMRKGGIAVFDLSAARKPAYVGSIHGINPGPRDLRVSADGRFLFASCNASGFVSKTPIEKILKPLLDLKPEVADRNIRLTKKELEVKEAFVGLGSRSIELSHDDRYLFVAVNQTSELIALDAREMKILSRIAVDSYPVGLDLSPDGLQVWVTSQGRGGLGGNSVGAYQVRYRNDELLKKAQKP